MLKQTIKMKRTRDAVPFTIKDFIARVPMPQMRNTDYLRLFTYVASLQALVGKKDEWFEYCLKAFPRVYFFERVPIAMLWPEDDDWEVTFTLLWGATPSIEPTEELCELAHQINTLL